MARGAPGHRPVRGAVVAAHVDPAIVSNIAKTRGGSESHSVPFAALTGNDLDAPTSPDRFLGAGEVGRSLGERALELARGAGGSAPRCRDPIVRSAIDASTDAGRG